MAQKRKQLTEEEIWDDSALIDSWNEALAEYKYYHSLHARGEKVEDVLREADDADSRAVNGDEGSTSYERPKKHVGGGEVTGALGTDTLVQEEPENYDDNGEVDEGDLTANVTQDVETGQPATSFGNVPQFVTNGMENDALKNLMMAWYYAGYYTGLYEGQQRAVQQHVDAS